MNRGEIITRMREEAPEITQNVASDSVLKSWVEVGDQEVCTKVRLIKGQTTFSSIVNERTYSLTSEIPKFYDIDEYPGGGVAYDNRRIDLESIASIDDKRPSWRTESSGSPKDYFRRGGDLVLGRKPSEVKDIEVYSVLISDPLDNDGKTPFNQLSYLEPFHYSLVLYLKMRVFQGKVRKKDKAEEATAEYNAYINWMKDEIERGIYTNIQLRPASNYRGVSRYRTR